MTIALHPKAQLAFDAANLAFSKEIAKPGSKIKLTSSKRAVAKQFDLYVGFLRYKFFDAGVPFAPANRPGTSNHEYGLAIDIVIGQPNEAEARKALIQNGWVLHSNPKDPWHYDCSGIPEWTTIQAKIRKVRDTSSKDFVEKIQKYLESEKTVGEKWTGRAELLSRLESTASKLTEVRKSRNKVVTELESLKDSVVSAQDRLNRERERCKRYKERDVDGYKYTQCPDGNPLSDCTSDGHARFRQVYFKEKRRREERLKRWSIKIDRSNKQIERSKNQQTKLDRELAALTQDEKKYDEEQKKIQKEYDKKAETVSAELLVINDFETNKSKWIADLQTIVDKVISSS